MGYSMAYVAMWPRVFSKTWGFILGTWGGHPVTPLANTIGSLDALGPLYEQVVAGDTVDPSKAKEVMEASIALLGNSAVYLPAERRKSLMKHLNKDLQPLCKGKFPSSDQ